MDSDGLTGSIIIIAFILIKGFFTICETAVTEINDSKIKGYENEKGAKKTLYNVLSKPSGFITAFSVNRIFTAVIIAYLSVIYYYIPLTDRFIKLFYGEETETLLYDARYLGAKIFSLILILTGTVLVMTVFCDGLPKRAVNPDNCEKLAFLCAPAVKFLILFFKPVTALSSLFVNLLAMLFGFSQSSGKDIVTEEEIRMMVDAGNETGVIEESQRDMINNIFDFDELSVSDIMTHRTDIIAVELEASVSEVVNASIGSGFSRIPVYDESVDHITGIICVKDLLCLIGSGTAGEANVKGFARDIIYLPESLHCREAFKRLTANKMQMAVAIDEYGGTAGIITMEDIVEAVFGNIQDEYDDEEDELTRISDDTYVINGTADPEYILEQLGISLPEDKEFDTMSGFIVDLLGRIPEEGEHPAVAYGDVQFTVLIIEDMCITKIKAIIQKTNNDTKENEEHYEEKN